MHRTELLYALYAKGGRGWEWGLGVWGVTGAPCYSSTEIDITT